MPASFSHYANAFKVGLIGGGEAHELAPRPKNDQSDKIFLELSQALINVQYFTRSHVGLKIGTFKMYLPLPFLSA